MDDVKPPRSITGASKGARLLARVAEPVTWFAGPVVTDGEAVRAWLDGLEPEARVRLPVIVHRSPLGGVASARLVGDGPTLALDDTRMGISLADRLAAQCDAKAAACAVWLVGDWQPRGPVPGEPGALRLAVRGVDGPVAPAAGDDPPRLARALPSPGR